MTGKAQLDYHEVTLKSQTRSVAAFFEQLRVQPILEGLEKSVPFR